jgi:hypothetical protein
MVINHLLVSDQFEFIMKLKTEYVPVLQLNVSLGPCIFPQNNWNKFIVVIVLCCHGKNLGPFEQNIRIWKGTVEWMEAQNEDLQCPCINPTMWVVWACGTWLFDFFPPSSPIFFIYVFMLWKWCSTFHMFILGSIIFCSQKSFLSSFHPFACKVFINLGKK